MAFVSDNNSLRMGFQAVYHLGEVRDVHREPLVGGQGFLILGPVALHPAVECEECDLLPRATSRR